MRNTLISILGLIFTLSVFSQSEEESLSINGMLKDEQSSPVEYASVILLTKDSTYVKGNSSSLDGKFRMSDIPSGEYLLKISLLGFNDAYVNIPQTDGHLDVGTIVMEGNAELLDEVVVTGNRVIDKADRQVTLPTTMQVKSSVQGFDLLGKMSIPDILVNPTQQSIVAADGGNVQLRINGVKANTNELLAIRSGDVLRVETYNALGARFGNEDASVIIDIILKEKQTGGYVMTDLMNALTTGFGNDMVMGKVNHKDSEFGVMYYLNYRDYDERWNEKTMGFNDPDNTFVRTESGIPTPFDYQFHNLNLSYNLTSKDKYVFNAIYKGQFLDGNRDLRSTMNYSNNPQPIHMNTDNKTAFRSPVLDLFFKYNLPKKQTISANLVGTHIQTDNNRHYIEQDNLSVLTDVYNIAEGDRYSIIGEFIYEKGFDKVSLSAGAKHTQGYADNLYIEDESIDRSNMKDANTYLFINAGGKVANFDYSVGVGVTRLWYDNNEQEVTFYTFRPSVQLSYKINDHLSTRYSFSVTSEPPSLGQLTTSIQRIDSFQISRGNSGLNPYNVYDNKLSLNFNKGILSSSLNLRYTYNDNPIMNTVYLEDHQYVNTYENQENLEIFGGFANMNLQLVKDIWNISLTGGIDRYHSLGKSYSHYHTSPWGNLNSNVNYKNFDLSMVVNFRKSSLWGETISYGEDWQQIELGYKHKDLRFAAGMSYPFKNEWSAGSENLSKLNPTESWTYIADNGHMLYLRFSWNISFGKKSQSEGKTLNNADRDTGIRSLD